ncbi:hypothetical protein OG900_29760 [Streptomyces sp. NBC_00433]
MIRCKPLAIRDEALFFPWCRYGGKVYEHLSDTPGNAVPGQRVLHERLQARPGSDLLGHAPGSEGGVTRAGLLAKLKVEAKVWAAATAALVASVVVSLLNAAQDNLAFLVSAGSGGARQRPLVKDKGPQNGRGREYRLSVEVRTERPACRTPQTIRPFPVTPSSAPGYAVA